MTDQKLVVLFRNSTCSPARTQQIESAIADRVTVLAGGVSELKQSWDAPDRMTNPASHFNRIFNSAVRTVFSDCDYSPTAAKDAKFSVIWVKPE